MSVNIVNGKVYNLKGNVGIVGDKVYCNGKLILKESKESE